MDDDAKIGLPYNFTRCREQRVWTMLIEYPMARAIKKTTALMAAALILGCYQSKEPSDDVLITSEAGSVYAELCRYWQRCNPSRLDFFPESTIDACASFYQCHLDRADTGSIFNDADDCRRHIEESPCDALLSSISPRVIVTWMRLPEAGSRVQDIGLLLNDRHSLWEVPACAPASATSAADTIGPDEACLIPLSRCGDGRYCQAADPTRSVGTNVCGTCRLPQQQGESCNATLQCEAGAFCLHGVCRPPLTNNAGCDEDRLCESGACVHGVCSDPGETGASCDSSDDCREDDCIKGVCTAVPFSEQGEPCTQMLTEASTVSVPILCNPDKALFCRQQTCAPLGREGAPCTSSAHCRMGLVCESETCVKAACPIADGASCNGNAIRCGPESSCNSNDICQRWAEEGTPCHGLWHPCFPGLFCNNVNGGICEVKRANGTPCDSFGECESDYCHRDLGDCDIIEPGLVECENDFFPCDDCGVCSERPSPDQCIP